MSSLCVDTIATGGEEQCVNTVVALQYGRQADGRAVGTLTYQQIFNLKMFSAPHSMVNGSATNSVLTVCHLQTAWCLST